MGKISNPRLSRVYLYPENQWYPFLVMRQNISAPTAMVARPVGVNTAAKFTNGLTTQMLLIWSESAPNTDWMPRRMELSSIPAKYHATRPSGIRYFHSPLCLL